jgi:hypothetical protein
MPTKMAQWPHWPRRGYRPDQRSRGSVLELLPDEVRRFIATNIRSVAQLELLLMLRTGPDRWFTAEEISRSLYMAEEPTVVQLSELESGGVIVQDTAGGGRRYHYQPRDVELALLIDQLAELYRNRRLAVTNAIYAGPTERIQIFSDAFRLRKDK